MTPEKKAKLAEGRRRRDITAVYDKLHEGKLGAHVLWCMVEQVAAGQAEKDVMKDNGYVFDKSERAPLSEKEIREWWSHENGLEDCDPCKLEDFTRMIRAVEEKHDIKSA